MTGRRLFVDTKIIVVLMSAVAFWGLSCTKVGSSQSSECDEGESVSCECSEGDFKYGIKVCEEGAFTQCDCSGATVPPTKAGMVGRLIPFQLRPGKIVGLLSRPQSFITYLPLETQFRALWSGKADSTAGPSADLLASCGPFEIHDQGPFGWCSAHSTLGAMELQRCRQTLSTERLSESHLWDLGMGMSEPCAGGWFASEAARISKEHFIAPFATWPLPLFDENCADNVDKVVDADPGDEELALAGVVRVDTYTHIPGFNVDSVREALSAGAPVVVGVPVYANTGWHEDDRDKFGNVFQSITPPYIDPPNDSKGYSCRCECFAADTDCTECDPPNTHCLSGFHDILVVGYSDESQRFRVANSWGEDWPRIGDDGTFWMDYDYVTYYSDGGVAIQAVELCFDGACETLDNPPEYPDGTEICDGLDNDGDGDTDEEAVDAPTWYVDKDLDGFGGTETATFCHLLPPKDSCSWGLDKRFTLASGDCDDENAWIAPGMPEYCDNIDNDCDGETDEHPFVKDRWYEDKDDDGRGNPEVFQDGCSPGDGWTKDCCDCDDNQSGIRHEHCHELNYYNALYSCDSMDVCSPPGPKVISGSLESDYWETGCHDWTALKSICEPGEMPNPFGVVTYELYGDNCNVSVAVQDKDGEMVGQKGMILAQWPKEAGEFLKSLEMPYFKVCADVDKDCSYKLTVDWIPECQPAMPEYSVCPIDDMSCTADLLEAPVMPEWEGQDKTWCAVGFFGYPGQKEAPGYKIDIDSPGILSIACSRSYSFLPFETWEDYPVHTTVSHNLRRNCESLIVRRIGGEMVAESVVSNVSHVTPEGEVGSRLEFPVDSDTWIISPNYLPGKGDFSHGAGEFRITAKFIPAPATTEIEPNDDDGKCGRVPIPSSSLPLNGTATGLLGYPRPIANPAVDSTLNVDTFDYWHFEVSEPTFFRFNLATEGLLDLGVVNSLAARELYQGGYPGYEDCDLLTEGLPKWACNVSLPVGIIQVDSVSGEEEVPGVIYRWAGPTGGSHTQLDSGEFFLEPGEYYLYVGIRRDVITYNKVMEASEPDEEFPIRPNFGPYSITTRSRTVGH
jgi:hypothetical protein